jgi:sortase A
MTTLEDRPDHEGAGAAQEDAFCPHCGGPMAVGVGLPWPTDPALCPSCQRWVGRGRAVAGAESTGGGAVAGASPSAENGGGVGANGGAADGAGVPSRRRRGRPGSTERRRAREGAPRPAPVEAASASPAAAGDGSPAPDERSLGPDAAVAPAPEGADGHGGAGANDSGTVHGPVAETEVGSPAAHAEHAPEAEHAGDVDATDAQPQPAPEDAAPVNPNGAAAPPAEPAAPAEEDGHAEPPPADGHTLPFPVVVPEPPKRRRFSLRRRSEPSEPRRPLLRRPTRAGLLRALPFVLLTIGALLLLEGALTVLWKEPFSALLTAQGESALEDDLERKEQEAAAEAARNRKQMARYQARRAVKLNRTAGTSEALGRLRIPKIGLNKVVVQGTDEAVSLKKGPGHYTETPLPGRTGNWTVGIAGHRTTYGAPFRRINELKKGNKIVFAVPYGRFTYEVEKTKIVDAGYTQAFVPQGKDKIVLTACHPLYSAAQRILVYGRLKTTEPAGGAKRVAQN